jgi:hypothetical protein
MGDPRRGLARTTHIVNPARSWVSRASRWGAWCLLFVPATIVAHELGHLTAAAALGFPDVALHFSSISHGDIAGKPAWTNGVVGLSGPLVTVIITLVACAAIALRGGPPWAFALAISAASRFVVGVPYTMVSIALLLGNRRLAPPEFDEHKAASALGWSGDAVLGFTALFLIAILVWIGYRLPRGERIAAWPGLLVGTVLGWALWMGLVGRFVLP